MDKKEELREVLLKELKGVGYRGKDSYYWESDIRRCVERIVGLKECIVAGSNGQYITVYVRVGEEETQYGWKKPVCKPFVCVEVKLKKGKYNYGKYEWNYDDFIVHYFDDFETVREKYKEEKAKRDDKKENEIKQVLDTVYKLNMSINEFDNIVGYYERNETEIKKRLEK